MMRYVVVGAAGYGQEVAWSLREEDSAAGREASFVFLDDHLPRGAVASGLGEIVGTLDCAADLARQPDVSFVLGVGLPRSKCAVVERLAPLRPKWRTVVHPRATIGANVALGEGSYVGVGAVVTVNVAIGRFATVNLHCQVAHDDTVGDFATLHPDVHLSGNVTIGDGAELGTGAVVIPGVNVGPWAVLGAGCVAVESLEGRATYVGMPARAISRPRLCITTPAR